MKFRLTHNTYFPTYFKTKKEALEWKNSRPDANEFTLEKKIAYEWRKCE